MMRKFLVVCVVVAICVGMATAGKKERTRKDRRKEGKRARPQADAVQADHAEEPITTSTSNPKEQPPTVPQVNPSQPESPAGSDQATDTERHNPPRCSEWVWGSCEVRDGRSCGRGVERATRDGENCKKKEQDRPCRVYCRERAQGDKAREGKKKGSGSKDRQNDGGQSTKGAGRDPPKRNKAEKMGEGTDPQKCKYDKKDWTDCDEQTSLQMRTYTLKAGDPTLCEQKKVITKPCDKYQRRLENKNGCEYVLGPWGYCNVTSDMRERRDTLTDPSKESDGCRLIREIHQRCAVACIYSWGEWSECDEEEQKRLIVGTLERDDITPPDCQETVTRTKPCYGKNGTEKCLFGPWSGFGKCVEGFKLRTRKLLVGDRRCELRASHAVPCKG